jgi:Na+/H+ antiporter NhaA
MSAEIIGYTIGLFVASLAIAMILQFILNKIPPLKTRLRVSYGIAFIVGALLVAASADTGVHGSFAGALLFLAMFYLFKRDCSKQSK